MSVSIIGNNCCACRTCVQVCAHKAITIQKDEDGYEQVCVDEKSCVECRLCEKVCPILTLRKPAARQKPKLCGAALAQDDKLKEKSSSGGLFGIFAQSVIDNGGVVYGAAFDNHLQLKTKRAVSKDELTPLYKSKYLLCDTGNSFKHIKDDLKSGKTVLYCSSPCQIAGLQAYLMRDYDNLLCIEFACHGVGNQQQFDQSIRFLEAKKRIKITQFEFRHKTKNASSSHYFEYEGLIEGRPFKKKGLYIYIPYYNAYCKQWICREICYRCPYANSERNADITIGDFHTIGKFIPDIDRFKGVSMFLCNTEKGLSFFENNKDKIEVYPLAWEDIKNENRFSGVGQAPKERASLLNSIREHGYDETVKTMLNPLKDWKRIIYYNLPLFVRKKIMKL